MKGRAQFLDPRGERHPEPGAHPEAPTDSASPADPPSPAGSGPTASRLPALDALRGLAVGVILVQQCLLTMPAFSRAHRASTPWPEHDLGWVLSFTPLHLLWAGTEAAYCLVLISGFVLALPGATSPTTRAASTSRATPTSRAAPTTPHGHPDWLAYYPYRFVRLYPPVLAATALALLIGALVPSGRPGPGDSPPVQVLVLHPVPWVLALPTVCWLGLPCWLWLVDRWRRGGLLAVAPGVALAVLGDAVGMPVVSVLGVFLTGVALGRSRHLLPAIAALAARAQNPRGLAVGVALITVTLTTGQWLYLMVVGHRGVIGFTAMICGCLMLVALAVMAPCWRPVRVARPWRWLGTRAFSVYLVHQPVVIAVATLLGPWLNPYSILMFGGPAALATGWLFHRWVEVPSRRLARPASRIGSILADDAPTLRLRVTAIEPRRAAPSGLAAVRSRLRPAVAPDAAQRPRRPRRRGRAAPRTPC